MLGVRHPAVFGPADFRYLDVRRSRASIVALASGAWVLGVAAGPVPSCLLLAAGGFVSFAIPLALVGGLLRLVRGHGATLQAVAGSLAIYLCIGLAFAWVIGLVARLDPGAYFTAGGDGAQSARVYFSFSVLTTTGFGVLVGSFGRR